MEFYSDEIEVRFERPPTMRKRPGLPASFTWRGRNYVIVQLLKEWHDYRKRGKARSFYEKERGSYRARRSQRRGTWGVGRDYYRVRTECGEVFDIYYDRSPKAQERTGQWILSRRLKDKSDR